MKISYKWLQTYFKEQLPPAEKIADIFTFHAFEVESVERIKDDVVLDIKVLPDRACYCLSHMGMAKELSAFIDNKFLPRDFSSVSKAENIKAVNIKISDTKKCDRYVSARVLNISKKESPSWLKDRLETLGQRSINFIVDITNFVMLDIGQPMHAFDADKVVGDIEVRLAKAGEKMTTLDNKEIILSNEDLVVADQEGVLAIAGVKGGKRAEVGEYTNHIILEAAHFDATAVRNTSNRVGIKNESSKRFENNLNEELAPIAMKYFLSLLSKEDSGAFLGEIYDEDYTEKKVRTIKVSFEFIRNILGKDYKTEEIVDALERIGINPQNEGQEMLIHIPNERKDVSIASDIADEVGRVLGYENIKEEIPNISSNLEINKDISYANKIRNFLTSAQFCEVYTYALKDKGVVEIANPLASDKSFLRENLSDAIEDRLIFNLRNSDILGLQKIKIFEIGKIFTKDGEKTSLAIGIAHKKITKDSRPNDEIKEIRDQLFKHLGVDIQILCTIDDSGGIISHNGKQIGMTNNKDGILEMDLDYLVSILPEVKEEFSLDVITTNNKYKAISIYPFATRDIAVFVPGEGGRENAVLEIIKKHGGDNLYRSDLFDTFTKTNKETGEKKTSYAYHLVFQSKFKTLEEEEINNVMKNISEAMDREGWEVR